jgi:flagellum-specific ATP synthase
MVGTGSKGIGTPGMTIFDRQLNILQSLNPMEVSGTIVGVSGLIITANDFPVPVGSQCQILRRSGQPLEAEVVGFQGHQAVIMPYGELKR